MLAGLGVDGTELLGETRKTLGRAPEAREAAPAPARDRAVSAAWALPMLVGALLLGAGILIGWAIWG